MLFSKRTIALVATFALFLLPMAGWSQSQPAPEAAQPAVHETAGHDALPTALSGTVAEGEAHGENAEEAATPRAHVMFEIHLGTLDLPITNSMVTSWIVSLVLIIAVRWAVGRPKIIPGRGQAIVESLVGGIRDLIEPIVGKHMVGPTFPLLIGLFTFILIQYWSGMIPGMGAIYYVHDGVRVEFLRSGNADLNMTLALALVHFVAWFYFVLRYAGPRVLLFDVFGNKADKNEIPGYIYFPLFLVFGAVGVIEIISILFRNISLPFRLFGNVYGGEQLLASMTGLIGWIVPVPFYFLEVLIGFVQALVFTLLVSVYIGLICNHEGGHSEGDLAEGHSH